jgi:hypothetical protein
VFENDSRLTARDALAALRRRVNVTKGFALSLAAAAAGLALLVAPTATAGKQKPFVLTALAEIGTVYWRYDCVHYRTARVSLGVHWSGQATTRVTYQAGTLTRRRTLPRHRIWFPFTNQRFQHLSFVQFIEPLTLYASVKIDLGRRGTNHGYDHCQSYFPPQFSAQLRARLH